MPAFKTIALVALTPCARSFYPRVGLSQEIPRMGFELTNLTLPLHEIKHGGPPRDGIPSIDQPKFVSKGAASHLELGDLAIGVSFNNVSKAYPIKILSWHEIVNDQVDEKPVVVTYCPLCRSGVVFDALMDKQVYEFGVSGLLYNSDVLLYDRQTESPWSQLVGTAVAGELSGTALEMVPSAMVTWAEWKKKHPGTQVLSTEIGYAGNYEQTPYALYGLTEDLMFPINHQNKVLPNKELVVGIKFRGKYIAFPFSRLRKGNKVRTYGPLSVHFNKTARTAVVYDQDEKIYPSVTLYWFAWYAFHPSTQVYTGK